MRVRTNKVIVFTRSYEDLSHNVKAMLKDADITFKLVEFDKENNGEKLLDALQDEYRLDNVIKLVTFIGGRFMGDYDALIKSKKTGWLKEVLDQVGVSNSLSAV